MPDGRPFVKFLTSREFDDRCVLARPNAGSKAGLRTLPRWVSPLRLGLRLLAVTALFGIAWLLTTAASGRTPNAPGRHRIITISETVHGWWLTKWQTNHVTCEIYVSHSGLPTRQEVLDACGQEVYQTWLTTAPCLPAEQGGDASTCKGLYLHQAGESVVQREVTVDLPTPDIKLSLQGCEPTPSDDRCSQLPSLDFAAYEPLPNERILSVRGTVDGVAFRCDSDHCFIQLSPTRPSGSTVYFWAESSFGDRTPAYTAKVRVVPVGPAGSQQGWYVDVLSSQWSGPAPPACSVMWDSLPPVGGLPAWLSTPKDATGLASDSPYAYLAGSLIRIGQVDASSCPDGGLLPSGAASPCGQAAAGPAVTAWQNRFDQPILRVAQTSHVPAALLKRMFAQESQFWPGTYFDSKEIGLGQITESGADTTLLWNPSFFVQFCPLVLGQGACGQGYLQLRPGEQALLRGALAGQANASCTTCPAGVDMDRADQSVGVFAATLTANCQQVGWMIKSIADLQPGDATTYDDLWRLTLANYNAGPGCTAKAIQDAWQREGRLDWATVSTHLAPVCANSIRYVQQITGDSAGTANP